MLQRFQVFVGSGDPRRASWALSLIALVALLGAGCDPSPPEAAPPGGPAPAEKAPAVAAVRQRELDRHFEAIKDLDFPWGNVGSVAEALGWLQLKENFPAPRYEVLSGLQYHDGTGRTLGELDLIVWRTDRDEAVYVYEVKVSRNLDRAGRKARSQLARFRDAVAKGTVARFTYEWDRDRPFEAGQFARVEGWRLLGSKGSKAAGWDGEVDLTRDEADVLQKRILSYRRGK